MNFGADYERLVGAVSIPVIVQDASGYVGKPMSIELQAKMLRDFGERHFVQAGGFADRAASDGFA